MGSIECDAFYSAAYSSSRRLEKSSRCAENHFKFRLCAIPSFPCCFWGRSFSQEKMLPATFERDKSQYRVSTKRDYKGKMTIFRFGQDICWRVSKLRRLGILLKAVKCRVRKPLSIPASTPNIYFQPRAISTHSICSSWWLSFAPKRSPLSPTTSTALIFRAWLYFLLSSRWVGASSVQGYNLTSSKN